MDSGIAMETKDGQSKRQRILSLHKKLHSEVKPEAEQPSPHLNLKKSEIRKLLGDPLPLPYTIHPRDAKRAHTPTYRSTEAPKQPEVPRATRENERWKSERLRASIESMLRPKTPKTPKLETPVPQATQLTPVGQIHFPSPTRRITDLHEKDELLKEFRNDVTPPKHVAQRKVPTTFIVFLILISLLCGILS